MAIKGPRGRMLKLVTDEQVESIYQSALRVLEKVGVSVKSDKLTDVFAKAGCEVSTKERRATIPRHVVQKALEKAPKSVTLSGRNPERDVICEGDTVNFVFGGTPNAHFIDLESGEFRRPTLKDMEAVTTIADYFGTYAVLMTTAGGFDAPSGRTSPSSITRSSRTCPAGDSSATSSKKRVPSCACSNAPARVSTAPVNAPRRCPNNSASTRLSGIAPTFRGTYCPLRPLRSCMARAMMSFPVPDSP